MSTSLRDQLLKAGLISKKQADDAERKLEHQERLARRPPPAKNAAQPPGNKPNVARPPVPTSGASAPTPTAGKPAGVMAPRAAGVDTPPAGAAHRTGGAAKPPAGAAHRVGGAAQPPAGAAHRARGAPAGATHQAGAGAKPPAGAAKPITPASVALSAKLLRDQALNRQQQEKAEKKAKIAAVRQMIEQNRLTTVDSGDPYHFVDGIKIRQIPVNAALRSRLVGGELGIVRYYGRYDIVPTSLIARLRERDDQVLVIGGADSNRVADAEAQYPGFAVPDDLIW